MSTYGPLVAQKPLNNQNKRLWGGGWEAGTVTIGSNEKISSAYNVLEIEDVMSREGPERRRKGDLGRVSP
jgi:hypothetical protein